MATRTSTEIRSEIEARFGFFPPFFEPALPTPRVLESLWQQTLAAYIENPIPSLFKEKLTASIARFCTVPYCLLCHSSALRPLGMKSSEVLKLLQEDPLDYSELAFQAKKLGLQKLIEWPEAGSETEICIFNCCLAIFLNQDAEDCQAKLRQVLPNDLYDYLNLFLAYNKTCLSWAEAHPELDYQSDQRVQDHYASLVSEDPKLADFFSNYRGRVKEQTARREQWLSQENKLLVDELRKNQEWLSATLHGIGDAVIATNAEKAPRITFLNGIAEKLTGWSLEAAKGKPVDEVFKIINSKTRLPAANPIEQVITTGQVQDLVNHTVLIRRDGLEFIIENSAAPIKDSSGSVQGVVLVFRDVTDRKNAEAALMFERYKLSAMMDVSPIGIGLMRGHDLVFDMVNDKFKKLVGDRNYIGRKWQDVYAELPNSPLIPIMQNVLTTGKPYLAYERPIKIEGQPGVLEDRYYDFTYAQVNDGEGKPYGVYLQCSDVTDRVVAKMQVAENNVKLKAAINEALSAKEEAERANQTKSSFLANMSHEIRTPLGAIIGFTDLLREKNLDLNDREQFLDTISRNGKALTRIIDDILDLAKVESGKLEIESIDFALSSLISDVIDLFRERTRAKGIYLRVRSEIGSAQRVISDPTRLRQILINVVGNAVKFTNVGGVTIDVQQQTTSDQNGRVIITVKDTGVGITAAQREKPFQPFMQADNSTTRKFGGTGLGLSLSQRLAQALGGNITIEDGDSGQGCNFKISVLVALPKASVYSVTEVKLAPVSPALKNELPLSGVKFLIADDSVDNQFLLERILTKVGATVTKADNGLSAFRKGVEGNFDIILMDIQMPEMDGYEATRSLREAGFRKPIIALTAHAMAEERARTIAAGCDGHLTKPINQLDLLATVKKFLKPEIPGVNLGSHWL